MSSRPQWQETSDADSDSSEQRLAMVDALEEMADQAEARDRALIYGDDDSDDEDDDDYIDAEDEEDDDEDFDVEDMEEVVGDIEIGEEDEDDDDDDEEDDEGQGRIELAIGDDEGGAEERVSLTVQELLQRVLAPRSAAATQSAQESRTTRALQGIGIPGLRQLLAQGGFRLSTGEDDDDDDDDDEGANWYGSTRSTKMSEFWEPIKSPIQAGQELLGGGDFGRTRKRPFGSPPSAFDSGRNVVDRIQKRRTSRRPVPKDEMDDLLPNSSGTEVARYPARVYCGQYSQDSSFFYTCTQDFRVQMYDTTAASSRRVLRMHEGNSSLPRRSQYYTSFGSTQYTSLKPIKTIQGRMGSWTITDANLSPDNQWMIYSSITPTVHLVSTRAEAQGAQDFSDRQVPLDFSAGADDGGGVRYRSGIWSIRFSGDSREIVAGAHFGDIYVYDIEARRRVLRVEGHRDDVNGVAFADSASSNVLISASDDTFVKVWDRRSLSGGKPAGVLPGHTEGITYVAPKGDGRYCISNGKDQSLKLWDLRSMHSSTPGTPDISQSNRSYGLVNWDYRNMYYRKPRYQSHPDDCSVMTYRGHAVLKTLIRCHFSPEATTGQKYVYSGSADGRIHIWSLDGRIVRVLDRSKARSIFDPSGGAGGESGVVEGQMAADPSAPDWEGSDERDEDDGARGDGPTVAGYSRSHAYGAAAAARHRGAYASTVRDVSWHSSEPSIMSTAWDGSDGQRGSVAKHEWKGYGKGTSLEDAVARDMEEAREWRAL